MDRQAAARCGLIILRHWSGRIICIDQDAAGFGWFVDPTPNDDAEFAPGGPAAGRMDLLTVLAHELSHVLGLEHDSEPGHLMSETLAPGMRLLPIGTTDEIDNVFAVPEWLDESGDR